MAAPLTEDVTITESVETKEGPLEDASMRVLPDKPEEPLQSDCCGEGCTPCVFDIYDQELKRWEQECLKISTNAKGIDDSLETQVGVA